MISGIYFGDKLPDVLDDKKEEHQDMVVIADIPAERQQDCAVVLIINRLDIGFLLKINANNSTSFNKVIQQGLSFCPGRDNLLRRMRGKTTSLASLFNKER